MIWSLVIDVFIILLMGVTLFGIWRLSKYLKIFRQSRDDMSKLLRDLSNAAERADNSVQDLRRSAGQQGRKLQKKMDQAQSLIDELQFITAAAGNVADRLEKLTDTGGKTIRGESKGEGNDTSPDQSMPTDNDDGGNDTSAHERPFNQMGGEGDDNMSSGGGGDDRGSRSRAEEELLRAIRERRNKS